MFKLNEKNLGNISEQVMKITPKIKIFILNLEYPIEFFDLIKRKDDIIASNGMYNGLNILLKNSWDKLSNCFGALEHWNLNWFLSCKINNYWKTISSEIER